MSLWIGIEGGGSKTRVMVQRTADSRGHSSTDYFESSTSLKVVGGNFERSAAQLKTIIRECGIDGSEEVSAIAIGLSGMSQPDHQDSLRRAIHSLSGFETTTIHIETDALLSLSAALKPDENGILLIGGTGSVGYIRTAEGIHRVGGWGPLLSDEGSGYWIGLRALQYFVLAFEEREERDNLFDRILESLPSELREKPILLAQFVEVNPSYPATLAKVVLDAKDSSAVASEIVETAAGLLSGLVKTGLGLFEEEDTTVPVVLSGSIANHPAIVNYLTHMLFESGVELRLLEEKAPVRRALEIARRSTAIATESLFN